MRNSQQDAIQQSDLIVIGDVISGEKRQQNDVIDCHAKIHAARVLKNRDGFTGQEIAVHWQYQPRPDQPSDFTSNLSPVHAIWFLKKQRDDGEYEAMWAELFQQPMGGYLLPIPDGVPRAPLTYASNADYQRKLAGELAWAMQTLATAGGDRLNVVNEMVNPSKGNGRLESRPNVVYKTTALFFVPGSDNRAPQEHRFREQFDSIADIFQKLDASQSEDVSRYLIERPEIHLKAVGLQGELRTRNASALLLMETLYPRLNITWDSFSLAVAANSLDIRGNDAAIQAVGRMCLSEAHLSPFDGGAVSQLAATKSRTAVPYLETMLIHPEPSVRMSAARGICTTFASDPDLRRMADTAFIGACRFGTVAANRIGYHGPDVGAVEEFDVKALRAWLVTHSAEVRNFTGVDAPKAPRWFTRITITQ
jgi:hypothetical protein